MGDAQEGKRKGKAKTDFSNWSIKESKMLLLLMVEATSRGWRDVNDMLSKAIVESKILPLMRHSFGFGWDATTKKFTAPEEVWEDYFKNEPSHQPPPLGQSSSPLPFPNTSSEVHPVSTSQKKRTRTDNEGNSSSAETNHKSVIMEKISLSIDSIAADFRGVHSLLEKREKDIEKSEMEKREKERQNCIWDAIKKTPNLDERSRYKAVALLTNKTKNEAFLKMSPEKRSN
ncbi:hypothetical protein LWI28_027481 [Acer negundo]|uniref:At2g29880-like C-terminal domain-containing protein n=1 Tax=Acer negundo TaxID=4023 RepID=A0AAD5NU93_ACENE|nr:hypothetical protein LWI28_027481 [Acer negundo]